MVSSEYNLYMYSRYLGPVLDTEAGRILTDTIMLQWSEYSWVNLQKICATSAKPVEWTVVLRWFNAGPTSKTLAQH